MQNAPINVTREIILNSVAKMRSVIKGEIKGTLPKSRDGLINPLGWGFNDSRFEYDGKTFFFTGQRYPIANGVPFSNIKPYTEAHFGISIDDLKPAEKTEQRAENYPKPVENHDFLNGVKNAKIDFSDSFNERLFRAHGQSARETFALNFGSYPRLPDLVLFPTCHKDVEIIVRLANDFNVVLIPVGGCTNVTECSACPSGNEARQIAIVDCTQMNKMLWLDNENCLACFEAGIIGQDLERILNSNGFTMGHEPDSIEFSTLGGWVATRASGMKRQKYGNIEDIVKNFKMVTSAGTFDKKCMAPRVSMGPNMIEIILGSEGIFGIVTEVVIKVHPSPEVKRYGSIVFHDFESGVDCMRSIAKSSCQPASLRLIDNFHFEWSAMMRQSESRINDAVESVKRCYISKIKGYDLKKVAFATFLFEGRKDEVERDESVLLRIAKQHGGYSAGEGYGKMGYQITFYIAYIRDFLFDIGVFAESYETSVPWSKCKSLFSMIENFWAGEMKQLKFLQHQLGYRISQIYHDGVCCYFYFGYRPEVFSQESFDIFMGVRSKFLDVIQSAGGSLSHHHGIGRKLKGRYAKAVSEVEMRMLRAIKSEIDPKNVFAVSNLLSDSAAKAKL